MHLLNAVKSTSEIPAPPSARAPIPCQNLSRRTQPKCEKENPREITGEAGEIDGYGSHTGEENGGGAHLYSSSKVLLGVGRKEQTSSAAQGHDRGIGSYRRGRRGLSFGFGGICRWCSQWPVGLVAQPTSSHCVLHEPLRPLDRF
jgi:hypothetical protein